MNINVCVCLSNNKANVAGKINVTEQEFVFDGFEMWKENDCLDEYSDRFETGSCLIKN